MKKFRQILTSPITTVLLFAAAVGLLLFSSIGGARAAWLAVSDTYYGHVEMYDIGVSLLEESAQDPEGQPRKIAYRDYISNSQDKWDEVESATWGKGVGDLLVNLLAEGEEFVPGRTYKEKISVENSGTINEYVRVTIYKYWTDPSGNKVFTPADGAPAKGNTTQGLSPDLIRLNYINQDDGSGNGDWILDPLESSETEERTVFYYNKLLLAGEDTSATPLTDTLTIDRSVADKVTEKTVETTEDGYRVIRTSYDYDGWRFNVEAHVDAVQEHNAEDAIRSAWGRDVTFREDGTLSLE